MTKGKVDTLVSDGRTRVIVKLNPLLCDVSFIYHIKERLWVCVRLPEDSSKNYLSSTFLGDSCLTGHLNHSLDIYHLGGLRPNNFIIEDEGTVV